MEAVLMSCRLPVSESNTGTIPKFGMDDARKLLDGKFHEEDDEDDDLLTYSIGKQNLNQAFKAQSL